MNVLAPLIVLLVGGTFLATGRMFFLLDAVAEHGSFQRILDHCLAQDPAGMPMWNPWMFCGTPLLADPQMHVCYPPALLYRFLPHAVAAGAFVWLHIALAAAGAAAFLGARGTGNAAAQVGALAYALGGMPFMLAATPACLTGFAWLPWIAWLAGRGRPAALALGFAWLWLAGLPQAALYGFAAAVLGRGAADGRWVRGAVAAGGALLWGAAIAGAVLVPFALWLPHTTRAAPLTVTAALRDDLAFRHLVSFIAPFTAGLPGAGPVLDNRHLWPTFNCIGTLPLLCAVAGLFDRAGRRGAGPALAFTALGLALALGSNLPVAGPLLQSLPPFTFVRRSALWMMIADLGLAWLAARGLGRLGGARLAIAVGTVTCIELLAVGFAAQPSLPAAWIEAPPAAERLLAERAAKGWFRVYAVGGHDRTGVTSGETIRDAVAAQHAALRPNLLAGAGLRDVDGVDPLRGAAISARLGWPGGAPSPATLELLGVRYLVAPVPLTGRGEPVLRDHSYTYRSAAARPLAWVEPSGAGAVTGTPEERPGRLIASVRLDRPASVVFNQAWAPGWACEPPVLPGACVGPWQDVLMAVPLPAGRHRIVLRYRTPGLAAGTSVSAIALAVLLLGVWRRRRAPDHAKGVRRG